MRVLTFTTLYPNGAMPNHGMFVRKRMEAVARRPGVEVVVVAPVPSAPRLPGWSRAKVFSSVPKAEEIGGLSVHHPRFLSLPGEWARLKPRWIARGAWACVQALHRAQPFDIVDAHFARPDGAAAAEIARRIGLPLVLSVRGSDIHRDLERPRTRPLVLATLRAAASVISVAQPLTDKMIAAGIAADKIATIPNGIDLARWSHVDRDAARAEHGVADQRRIVLSVAAMKPVKGHDTLIEAFATLGTDGDISDTELWLAGAGPLHDELRRRVAQLGLTKRVRFLGAVPHDKLPSLYAAADIFALPSRNEGCPNVVLEALASGCPVAATAVGHVPHMVRNRENGLVVPADDPRAFALALRALLKTSPSRTVVRATVADCTWDDVAARVAGVFQGALDLKPNTETSISQCG